MEKVQIGNLNEKANDTNRGWFMGHFAEDNSLLNNDTVEVKSSQD